MSEGGSTVSASIDGERPRNPSARYGHRRDAILDVATRLLNERGFNGMTYADVARSLSLSTTSINYYFGKKETLAAAIVADSLDRLEEIAHEACTEASPQRRVSRYVTLHFAVCQAAAADGCRPFANLSEIRALDESIRPALLAQYQRVFRLVREFFGPCHTPSDKAWNTARAHILNETLFWAERWLGRYAPEDIDDVAERLIDILGGGVAPHSPRLKLAMPPSASLPHDRPSPCRASPRQDGEASFLPIATRLINDHGYRGASIDRIVAELRVTKGSFYHHLDAKDDLVLECFQRSYERTMATLRGDGRKTGPVWAGLGDALASLVDMQFGSAFPLMRSSALQAMPVPVRTTALALLERTALHIGGVLVEGMRDGSVRVTDPVIASQFLLSMVNASYDIRNWARRLGMKDAARIYMTIVQFGIFDARVC